MPATPTTAPILISASKYTLSPGDNVRVSGRFLQKASAVQIGSVTLSVLLNTASEIIFVVPSPAPSGTLSITTAGGKGTLGQPFKAASGGAGTGSSPAPPPPQSPSQAGAAAAVAYDAAYNAAKTEAAAAFQAAGGDAGGAAAHVAAQNAAGAAAVQAAGPGHAGTAKQAAAAAYNDFKAQNLATNNGPAPDINAQGGASGEGAGALSPGLSQLITTMNQWMQVLPQPLQTLARAATGLLQAALSMGQGMQGIGGGKGAALWSHFRNSMDVSSKDAFDAKNGGPSGGYGPNPAPQLPPRLQGIAEWAGKGIGQFAGKMGLVDAEGKVPPAMAGAIGAGIGTLLIGALNNVKGAFAAGSEASESYTNGLRSGFGAIESAARDVTGRIIGQLMKPFGASGAGVAGFAGAAMGGMSHVAGDLADMGADVRKTMTGAFVGVGTLVAGIVGAGIGAAFGPVGLAIGAFIMTSVGLLFGKALGFVADFVGKGFEIIGKAAGEVFKVGGEAVQAFVSVLTDCTQAAMEWAHTARSVANRSGMSDSTSAGMSWGLQGLGMSSVDVRGMFGSAANGQFNRALTGAAWGVQGMPVGGDFDPYANLSSIYERAQSLKKNAGPLGAEFQQSFLNSTGNGAMLDAVNLSPTAFHERMDFSKEFDPSAGDGGEKVKGFEEDFGTLVAEWNTFTSWLKVSFGTELLPVMKEMFGGIVGWVKQNKGGIIEAVKNAAGWIYKEMPAMILGGLRAVIAGVASVAGIIGAVMGAVGSNLPAILKGVESLINGFRSLIAMGMGLAAVAGSVATGGWKELLHAGDTYSKSSAKALKGMGGEFHMSELIPVDAQKAAARGLKHTGKWLKDAQGSMDGSKPNGSLTDNWVQKIDKTRADFDPSKRDLHSLNQSAATLQQIALNTARSAQNTARIGDDVGEATNQSLKNAMLDIVGVALRQSSRDNYFNARRA